jgi:transcriptional regulator with GAF, ATPase, and Fis domain
MPMLTIHTKGHSKQEKALLKSITLIGSDPFADIRLTDPRVPKIVAQIHRSGGSYIISSASSEIPVLVNNEPVTRRSMCDQDTIIVGNTHILFHEHISKATTRASNSAEPREFEAYSRLASFLSRLASETEVPRLLETLIDEIVSLTKAERAFLVLLEHEVLKVEVARNMHGETLIRTVNEMSDTILKRVLETKSALVVSNALDDQDFNASASVVNFKLTSVMCAPLMAHGELLGAIYVGNNGIVNAFDQESLKTLSVFAGQASLIIKNAMLINSLMQETRNLRENLNQARFGNLVGNCATMQHIYKKIEKVAATQSSVLLTGETGTGKELIAREIHHRSARQMGPFVVVNCGSIAENLLESELFGHVRGAFQGAFATRIGAFQAAHQGTLFLDEISEIPLYLQAKLLRALTERRVYKVGDTKSDAVDVRLMTTTHKKLLPLVASGLFREDFHYSLNVLNIETPPLRDRGNDVILLANSMLHKHATIAGKSIVGFTQAAQNALLNYSWPGNVRELESLICRAVVLCENARINVADLDIAASEEEDVISLADAVEQFRNKYIAYSLERNAGNRTRAAKELGVDPRTIFRHLEEQKKSDASVPPHA